MMAKIVYQGGHDAVEVPTAFGGWSTVPRGGVLETTDDHAAWLLEQPANWARDRALKSEVKS
jgi:hypothetical protein